MGSTYYPQSDHRPNTLTVGDLMKRLQDFDPAEPVIFQSPKNGVFGSDTKYSIDTAKRVEIERHEEHHSACRLTDIETGEVFEQEAWTQVFHAWSGVVIG